VTNHTFNFPMIGGDSKSVFLLPIAISTDMSEHTHTHTHTYTHTHTCICFHNMFTHKQQNTKRDFMEPNGGRSRDNRNDLSLLVFCVFFHCFITCHIICWNFVQGISLPSLFLLYLVLEVFSLHFQNHYMSFMTFG
jgi:hypothetical protein